MLNEDSLQKVKLARRDEHHVKPLYDTYCFSRIPNTIYNLLVGDGEPGLPAPALAGLPERVDRVILLLLDAFGWRFFEQYQEQSPFLRRFVSEGVVSKLTSQFPSTTAAHATTIHTGLPVGQSGVYEWFYYEPAVDNIIAPLLFSLAGSKYPGTLPVRAAAIFPQKTFYQRLREQGVKSTVFQHHDYTPSPFTNVVTVGAKTVPYATLAQGIEDLMDAVMAESERAYFFLYAGGIDIAGHLYGPGSPQFQAEVETTMTLFENLLHDQLSGKVRNTVLLVTADHGQIEVSPEDMLFVNQHCPWIESCVKFNWDGYLLAPAGSARDQFLYIQDEHLDTVHTRLSAELEDWAEVYRTQDLIAQGYFGPGQPSTTFMRRVGNLVVLPHPHKMVWWHDEKIPTKRFYGHHGGLTPQEMETIFLALAYE